MEALNAFLNGEEPGYAKLQGEHFDYFMQAHSIILGRNSKKENVDLDISVLGGGMEISRRHARIFYDFQLRRFALEVLGRHGCIVQGVLYLPGDGPVKLNSQDLLQIGQTKFYFLLPTRSIEATLVARRTHIPSQPLSSSFMRSTHPHSSDVREHSYGNDYGRDNGDNGIRVGTEAQGKFMKQSKRSGDLDIYSRYPINVEPVGALGERVNKLQIRRAAKNTDNERLLLKEEKDFITYVATLVSDNCGPGEWMPVVKLHSELIEHFGKIWPHSKVEKYLTPEDCSSKGRPWYNLLELLKKYPEHFVINEISRGKVTSEFVSLVSLLS